MSLDPAQQAQQATQENPQLAARTTISASECLYAAQQQELNSAKSRAGKRLHYLEQHKNEFHRLSQEIETISSAEDLDKAIKNSIAKFPVVK